MDKPSSGEWKRVRHPETDEHRVVAVNNGNATVIAVVGTQACDDGIVAANANLMAASKVLLEASTLAVGLLSRLPKYREPTAAEYEAAEAVCNELQAAVALAESTE